jgi:hypothetical protein
MFVAPPSVRSDGEYRWLNDLPIAEAPQWLLDLVTSKSNSKSTGNAGTPPRFKVADEFEGLDPTIGLAEGVEGPPPPKIENIIERCGWMREAFETGGKNLTGNMKWNLLVLCATFMENGHELAHRFSNQHKDYTKESTEEKWDEKIRARAGNPKLGWPQCKTIAAAGSTHCKSCLHFPKGKSPLNLALDHGGMSYTLEHGVDAGVKLNDFYAYMPLHNYIFAPSREPWPASSVNARIPPIVIGHDKEGNEITIRANVWIDKNQPVEMLTWAPGMPLIIADRLIAEGGWIERKDVSCFNLYRPPTIKLVDASKAKPWIDLVHKVYPDDADHMIKWFASRRQHPEVKINHGLVMGSQEQGVGKDTILEGVKRAVGAWNFKEVAPKNIFETFNPWRRAVILRVSEAKDMGDVTRFELYDGMKTLLAAPPDVLECNEKHIKQHYVLNCVGVVITTNHLTGGIYLPAEDRRHYVAWSKCKPADFAPGYWTAMWEWYDVGGDRHVAAYLDSLDISDFDPKAPPPKTPAFWAIVDANRAPEEGELQDLLDKLGNPDAVTVKQTIKAAIGTDHLDIKTWLVDRKNRRSIPHRFEAGGYVPVRNDASQSGLWVVGGVRQVVYAKKDLLPRDRLTAVAALQRKTDEEATTLQRKGTGRSTATPNTPPQKTDLDRDVVDLLNRPKK